MNLAMVSNSLIAMMSTTLNGYWANLLVIFHLLVKNSKDNDLTIDIITVRNFRTISMIYAVVHVMLMRGFICLPKLKIIMI